MSWTGFPSPLGDSILITGRRDRNRCPRASFRPLSGIQFSLPDTISLSMRFQIVVSVPSRGIHSHYMQYTVHHTCGHEESCRPLSGNQFSLPSTSSGVVKTWRRFPSPLGESILITRNEVSYEAAVALFPSPLGDSILITGAKTRGKVAVFGVSVPSRGFNSHYEDVKTGSGGKTGFPSPLGDSILITGL